jgi:predicted phosphodiesterase
MGAARRARFGWLGAALLAVAAAACAGASRAPEAGGEAAEAAGADDPARPEADDVPEAGTPGVDADAGARPAGPWEVPIGPVDRAFFAGPWLGETTPTSVTVSWQTDLPGDAVVEVGSDATYGRRAEGSADATLHEVRVTGLAPEALYHYRACTGATCTGDLTFATAPLPGRPFRFAVYGDSQTGADVHARLSARLVEDRPALVLHTGDVVGYGADRASYITEFFEPVRPRNHYVPTFPVPGNHDWKERIDLLQNFRDHFALPVDPGVPLPEASYAFSYGDAFFLALDNTLDGGDFFFPLGGAKTPPLWDWLQAQVASEAARGARWRFAFFHYPPQSACQETWMQMQATRDVVLPLLQQHGFHAVFTGHTHEYEHQLYDRVHVFVTGGGGGGLDTDESCTNALPELVMRRSEHHHLVVELGDGQATVRAVSVDGEEFDRVTLDREPDARSN